MAKKPRKAFLQAVAYSTNATVSVENLSAAQWSMLGHDTDDLSHEMNPDTSTSKNVLGESRFVHNGYEPEVSVDTFYADADEAIYETLVKNAMTEDFSEANNTGYYAKCELNTFTEGTTTATGTAYVQRCWIIPQSMGGDTSGFQIPFNVNPFGAVQKFNVSYNWATYAVTFTAAS